MAPSSLFLKAAALAVVGLGSGVSALLPYVVDDVYQGKPDGTGFFDMFDFFTVSSSLSAHATILITCRTMIPPMDMLTTKLRSPHLVAMVSPPSINMVKLSWVLTTQQTIPANK
jgi:hypothetical protein